MTPEELKAIVDAVKAAVLESLEDTTNVEGAARAMGMSKSWVEKNIGSIPHHDIGKRHVFSKQKCREHMLHNHMRY